MKEIVSHFLLSNEVEEPQALKVGFINDSYVLKSKLPGGTSYFLQRINHHIFENVDGLQRNIQLVTDHIRARLLAAGGALQDVERRVLRIVPTQDGQLYYRTPQGDCWRVYVLIDNAASYDKVTAQSAYLAGLAFGEFQCQLSDFQSDKLCETIPDFHNLEFRMQQLQEAVAQDKAGRVAACREMLKELFGRAESMCLAEQLYKEGRLFKRINHCDTKVNNMLFDTNGKPLCIVDLDTVMPGFVFSDFGDFMRTAANKAAEDEADLDKVRVDMEIFEAYTRGYLQKATFLTDLEKQLLPYGCCRMTYMQTVRFLTDYLNGDTYYKIQHTEHNWVRTQAQFRLFEEQEKMLPAMKSIVVKY